MDPIQIELVSSGERLCARFYPAVGNDQPRTLLFVPGWPANPEDFLDLGLLLSPRGINVMDFYPRGLHGSAGMYTHFGALQDIEVVLDWLCQSADAKGLKVDPSRLVLAGYSNGGGLALPYAARHPNIRYLIAIAANDFAQFARQYNSNQAFAEGTRSYLLSTLAPVGPARFDMEAGLREMIDHPDIFGFTENAEKLADRSILMVGGWDDMVITIDDFQLPLYRALKKAGATDVTFLAYHTDHNFANAYQRLAEDITAWLERG